MSEPEPLPSRSDGVTMALTGTDEEVGPACMNVPVPPTTVMDDDFREAYEQGYRHALADVRDRMAGKL